MRRGAEGEVLPAGSRVVLQPVLGCAARGIEPMCPACQAGNVGNCGYIAFGHIRPGLQTGFCADTGGGWSTSGLVAHSSQLYAVPDTLSDADAVTVEPVACAVHAVLGAPITDGDVVAVIGAGTLGLLVTAALTHLAGVGGRATPAAVLVGARYAHQQRLAARAGCRRGTALRPARPRRAPALALALLRRRVGSDRDALGGRRRRVRLRGQPRVDRTLPGHGAATGHRGPGRACRAR